MYYLYFLESIKDGKLYIGISVDLRRRLKQHNQGQVKSTKNRRPLRLVYRQSFATKNDAAKAEWLYKHVPGAGKMKRRLIEEFAKNRNM